MQRFDSSWAAADASRTQRLSCRLSLRCVRQGCRPSIARKLSFLRNADTSHTLHQDSVFRVQAKAKSPSTTQAMVPPAAAALPRRLLQSAPARRRGSNGRSRRPRRERSALLSSPSMLSLPPPIETPLLRHLGSSSATGRRHRPLPLPLHLSRQRVRRGTTRPFSREWIDVRRSEHGIGRLILGGLIAFRVFGGALNEKLFEEGGVARVGLPDGGAEIADLCVREQAGGVSERRGDEDEPS